MRTVLIVLAILSTFAFALPQASATSSCVGGGTQQVGGFWQSTPGAGVPAQQQQVPGVNLILVSTTPWTISTAGVGVGGGSVWIPYLTTVNPPQVCVDPAQTIQQVLTSLDGAAALP